MSESIKVSDDELMEKAKEFIAVERYLEAARYLRQVQDTTQLTTQFRHALLWADEITIFSKDPDESIPKTSTRCW